MGLKHRLDLQQLSLVVALCVSTCHRLLKMREVLLSVSE